MRTSVDTLSADTLPLELNELAKQFGSKPVINGVSLRLEPGTTLGLLGKNGAGSLCYAVL